MQDPNNPNANTTSLGAGAQRGEASSDRNELLNRLRAIIDDATQSVRSLKEENAALARRSRELEDRNGMLEQRLRLLTSGISQDEQALKQSIDRLAQTLRMPTAVPASAPASAPAPVGEPSATAAPMNESADMSDTASAPSEVAEADSPAPAVTSPEPESALAKAEPAPSEESSAYVAPESPDAASEMPANSVETLMPAPASDMVPEVPDHSADTAGLPAMTTGGVYTLITYPFVRFSDLGQFQAALQRLQGVHDVQVRRFAQGTLEMTARYEGETNLMTALRNLTAEIEEVREEAPYRLRVRLRARTDA